MQIFSKVSIQNGFRAQRGFTLLEMIVSTSVFVFVMLMIIGSLISLTDASRKARSMRIVLDNLSAAVDSMSRNMRMGTYFHCGCGGSLDVPNNCATPMASDGTGGDSCIAFESSTGNPTVATDQMVYRLTAGQIERSNDGGANWVNLTSPEIVVSKMNFFLYGATLNTDQPVITMVLQGTAALSPKTKTDFNIETTVAARTPNFANP